MENKQDYIKAKIKNNAIIAYFFIFINITFLFNKSNTLLNNNFVKNHTKTAILIHLGFLINTIIFVYYGLGLYKEIMGYSISDIIAISIYLVLFSFMIIGIYKAYFGKMFSIGEVLNHKNNKNILDITNSGDFNEKDKLTIIFSKIPFLGFFIYSKYKENKLIENNIKLNLIITISIVSLYVFGNPNLANLLLLFYIIFIVFISVNLFIKNEVINIDLDKIVDSNQILNNLKTLKIYLGNYFSSKKDFPSFNEILNTVIKNTKKDELEETKKLRTLNEFKLWKYIIYIPLLNIIALFNLNSKQKIHIINGILITLSFIILSLIFGIENKYQLFLLFPLSFGLGNMNTGILNYKIPFLYNIFELLIGVKNYFSRVLGKIKEIKNTEKEINLKVNKTSK